MRRKKKSSLERVDSEFTTSTQEVENSSRIINGAIISFGENEIVLFGI